MRIIMIFNWDIIFIWYILWYLIICRKGLGIENFCSFCEYIKMYLINLIKNISFIYYVILYIESLLGFDVINKFCFFKGNLKIF